MSYTVQSLSHAYSGAIPWHRAHEETFDTLEDARARRDEIRDDRTFVGGHLAAKRAKSGKFTPKRICSPGSWNGHERVILSHDAEPVTLAFTCHCVGSHQQWCETTALVQVVWEPGEPQPLVPDPEGWYGAQCPECRRRQQDIDAYYDQQEETQ